MDKRELVQDLASRFAGKKSAFLSEVRNAVSSFISGQGAGCVTLIERKMDGKEVWELSPHPGYALRLIAFCRGAKYDGHVIDSGLTDPVIGIVTRRFEMLYQGNDEEIAQAILNYIIQDKALSRGFVAAIVESAAAGYAAGAIKEKAAILILDQLNQVMQTAGAKAALATIGKTVAGVVSAPIATKIALLLMKFIALHLKAVIAKVLASAAIKGLIAVAVKKFLVAALAAALVKAIAAKFGISASAAFLWVLLPIIAAFLIYEIATFPQQLGEKVGNRIVEDLSDSYAKINDEVFERIVTEVLGIGVEALMGELGESEEIQDGIKALLAGVA